MRLIALRIAVGLILVCTQAHALDGGQPADHWAHFSAPEASTSVTLGKLSVKTLAVDRPWDPHVCIGCDRNNGSPFDKKSRLGAHSQ